MADGKIETRIIGSYSELASLEQQWVALLDRCRARTVFSTWEWVETVARHYGSALKPFVIAVFEDGKLMGVAPLAIVKRWKMFREVRFLGAGPFNYSMADYLDFIVADGMERTVVGAVVRELKTRSESWDVVDLREVRKTSPLITLLPNEATRNGLCSMTETFGSSYYLALPDTWEQYMEMLSSKMRSSLVGMTRKVIRDFSAVFEKVEDEEELARAMDVLIHVHTARWSPEGLPGIFALDGLKEFHMELATKLLRKGWLYLVLMYLDDQPAGAMYNFCYDGVMYNYTYGYDYSNVPTKYSLGLVITGHAVKSAIERGFRGYDFLRGHGGYKVRCGASRDEQFRLRLFKSRPAQFAYLGLRSLRATGKKADSYIRSRVSTISLRPGKADKATGWRTDHQA